MTLLEARSVSKSFGERVALKSVSMAAEPGEIVAIIGPNGAGKTTLLSIVAGIQPPDEGEISRPAGEVGWVPQQAAVYGKLTVAENLRLFARLEKRDDVEGVVAEMLEQINLRDRAGDQVATLSGGNRQRVNIAVGLLAEPDVLLLDEPSASLDPRQRERLWQFLRGRAERGTAIIFSTHNVAEAERNANRVIVLADGELIYSGTAREMEREVGGETDFESAFVEFLKSKGH